MRVPEYFVTYFNTSINSKLYSTYYHPTQVYLSLKIDKLFYYLFVYRLLSIFFRLRLKIY